MSVLGSRRLLRATDLSTSIAARVTDMTELWCQGMATVLSSPG